EFLSLYSYHKTVRAELVEALPFTFQEKYSPSTSSGRTDVGCSMGIHSIPNSSRASSLILDGSHGGSHTRLTTASRMPGTDSTRSSTSCGIDSATGQWGVVRVMVIVASPSSLTSTP